MAKAVDCLIKVEKDKVRPCIVNDSKKAFFHGWDFPTRVGFVEYENGVVDVVCYDRIKFMDTKTLIDQYCWDDVNVE